MTDTQGRPADYTMLCLSSLLRPFSDAAFDSLRRNLIPRISGDLVIIGHSPPGNESLVEALRPFCRALVWTFAADPVLSEAELAMDLRAERDINILRNNLLQWRSLEQCGERKRAYERAHGPARRVIWTRPDLLFVWPADIPEAVAPGVLLVSPHDLWGGLNDRFCIGDSATMAARMAIHSYFVNEWYPALLRDPQAVLGPEPATWNPEFVLASLARARGFAIQASYTLFCRLREIEGRLYAVTPNRLGFRSEFTGLMVDEDRAGARRAFDVRLARLLAEQRKPGARFDGRLPKYRTSLIRKLRIWLTGGHPFRRLVPAERVRALEAAG